MSLAPPSGFSENTLSPFIGFAIRFGVGAMSRAAKKSILLMGNILESAVTRTVGGTTYTTPAGTMALNTRTFCSGPDAARDLCGAGSPLHLMAQRVFEQNKRASVYLIGVAQNGSAVKATSILLFAGTPTVAGTVNLKIAGRRVPEQAFGTSDTGTTMAAALANAINKITDCPVSATVSTGTLTLTAKVGGARGNNIPLEIVITGTGLTVAIGGASAGAGGSSYMSAGTGTDGSGADDITDALAAVASTRNALIVSEIDDATNATLLRTHVNSYAAIAERKRQQAIIALTNKTVAQAISLAQGQNGVRLQVAYHRLVSPGSVYDPNVQSTGEIAAAIAAGRLYGDGAVGGGVGTVRGEEAYAAANLDGCMLAGVFEHAYSATDLTATELEALLAGGITPIVRSAKNPGFTEIFKSVTSRSLDGQSNPDYQVDDTSKVTVVDYVADGLEQRVYQEFPNKNLAPEPATPRPPPHPDVIYPSMARAAIIQAMFEYEAAGLLVNVEANLEALAVEQSATNKTLLLGSIPTDVIDHFHSMAGEILQIG